MTQFKLKLSLLYTYLLLIALVIPRRITLLGRLPVYKIIVIIEILIIFYEHRNIRLPKVLFPVPLLFFYLCLECSNFVHGDILNLFWTIVEYSGFLFIGYYCVEIMKKEELLKLLSYIGVFLALSAIAHEIFGINIFDLKGILTGSGANSVRFGIQRVYGPCTTSLNFGVLLSIISGIVTYQKITNGEIKYKVFNIVIWMAIILTLSRTAICTGIVIQLMIILIRGEYRHASYWKKLFFIVGVVVLILPVIFYFELIPKESILYKIYITTLAIFDDSIVAGTEYASLAGTADRENLFVWILDEIQGNELYGLGTDASFSLFINQWRTKTSIENTYLNILYHNGFIGLIGYLALIISSVLYCLKNRRKLLKTITINDVLLIILVCYYISSLAYGCMDERRVVLVLVGYVIRFNKRITVYKVYQENYLKYSQYGEGV